MGGIGTSGDEILQGLDDMQRAAATAVDGPVRIVAVAGAGKTRTVTRRIAYACATGAWDPARTLAVTFSVKAAAEMRARLGKLGVGESVTAATFHSAALHQLRRVWDDVCEGPFPHICDDQRALMARAFARVIETQPQEADLRDIHAEINWCKVSLIAPDDYPRVCAALGRRPPAGLEPQRLVDIYRAYEVEKTSRGEIDFNDILLIACHLLDEVPEAAEAIRSSIRWLTVDEYQDVSPLQHRLMRLWLGGNRNVCVVGDPAQTIYSFAGASSYDLLGFADEFAPLSADINLSVDYRSTPQIVRCANQVLAASPNRDDYLRLTSGREGGVRISRTVYATDADEACGVAAAIARLVEGGAQPGQCAVLTRLNAQQQVVCAALRREGLRYRVRRDAGWQRSALDDGQAGRQAMLEALGVGDDQGVTVSTIHAAKGLEFRHVFLVGCSEGLLPYGSPPPGDLLEEERRLMYVGITRAEETLHLSYARGKDGSAMGRRAPSRFLAT